VIAEACDRSLNVWVQCRVQISDGIIRGLGFSIFGCPHTVAAADWIGESLDGQPVERLTSVDIHAVARELEVPKAKLGKLLRIEDALMGCAKKVEGTQLVKGSD
jgi:NifU-like protein involved in Fe-S cluster formation